jgi:RNA polymerase sigma factor (sigma-70 family)
VTAPRDRDHPPDAEWMRALKRREAWAWERLKRLAMDRVFGYLFLRMARREDAEDLTSETFVAAYSAIGTFRGEASITTWLITIARRKLLDDARRRRRRPEILESEITAPEAGQNRNAAFPHVHGLDARHGSEETPETELERRETIARVRRLVLELPEAQREALWLRCFDQLSIEEVAVVLGRSPDAVKGLLHRAKNTLLKQLATEDGFRRHTFRLKEVHDAGTR